MIHGGKIKIKSLHAYMEMLIVVCHRHHYHIVISIDAVTLVYFTITATYAANICIHLRQDM